MVLIISNDHFSTNDIIDWLKYFNIAFYRISSTNSINLISIQFINRNTEIVLSIDNKHLNLSSIKAVYIRDGVLDLRNQYIVNLEVSMSIDPLLKMINADINTIKEFINEYLKSKTIMGNIYMQNSNKLINLFLANQIGFDIPDTLVTENIDEVNSFCQTKNKITKTISNSIDLYSSKYIYKLYTSKINRKFSSQKKIGLSLIQTMSKKLFEIRVFFLGGECYSMAIFSQKNSKTKVDYRNYDTNKENRAVPFEIPTDIKMKIIFLMEKLKLTSGSLDFIVTHDLNYIFLEVNPIGQFGALSLSCNYLLEKKIALYLTKCINNDK